VSAINADGESGQSAFDYAATYPATAAVYTVTYNANGGSVSPSSATVNAGSPVTLPTPARGGYTCTGWYTAASGGVKAGDAGGSYTPSADITLHAQWTNAPVTVTFSGLTANGSATATTTALTLTFSQAISGLAAGDITLTPNSTGAVKGALSGTSPTYTLALSGISAGGMVGIGVAKTGYTISGSPRSVTVFYYVYVPPAGGTAGNKTAYSGGGGEPSFNMVYVPGGVSFPTGISDISGTATVANAYEIGETEVTYELWYAVRAWAESNGYTFYNNPGREGSNGTNGAVPTANKQEPVTYLTWFDTVVWLNALTEWVNAKTGSGLTVVYYYGSGYAGVAKNSTDSSNFVKENSSHTYASAYAKPGTTGFRLPASNEWELAARWRGNDSTNTVSGYTNPYFTKGDSASGATASYSNAAATNAVAWYGYSTDFPGGTRKTQPVKGKVANSLGLYDMSGNVYEWNFDWSPSYIGFAHITRGGCFGDSAGILVLGTFLAEYGGGDHGYGIRPARTAN
jgi:formylglycine-generating enzyme required for sulfatase activity